ncbi:putative UBX domain-containing protein 1 [Amylocarpus encephaloides]|uniref:UBX domain-containing protein 1 n=1 Tax=Amylocarpus encephaloides TaxID=45428 RepID=A0A9P8C127_9HELO|nr:putative UBX domain-containing protein 1 [Amylocarpus encephaloides]
MADSANHDEVITEFCELTGAAPAEARQYLQANRFDLSSAATEYFTAQEEGVQAARRGGEEDPQETEAYTGPRTLDGRPAPAAIPTVGSSSRSVIPPKRGGIATLGSLAQDPSRGASRGHAHDDDDDDSDDEDFELDEQPRDLFAGGEKSGLAVQDPGNRNDPRKVVNDILKKARANTTRPGGGESSTATPSRFRGSGMTLGGDDAPSQQIPDLNPQAANPEPAQTRTLHLWEDGFSIEDGPLHRFDDPENAADLQMIRSGRAPTHLMGVRMDQRVDVQLMKHNSDYKVPPKVYKPFGGAGNRLGSPTPGPSSTTTSAPAPAPSSNLATSSSSAAAPEPTLNDAQPVVRLQIRLANGTPLRARFNPTHTIGDVYDFVTRASTDSGSRPWVIATAMPSKDHTNKSLALGDVPELRRGGNAVQKWV